MITLGLFDSAYLFSKKESPFKKDLAREKIWFDVKNTEDHKFLSSNAFYKPPFIPWPISEVIVEKYIENNDFFVKLIGDNLKSQYITDEAYINKIISGFKMPVFILWGNNDRLFDVSTVQSYKKMMPHAETFVINNCGHVPILEYPKESAKQYLAFLGRYKLLV